MLSAAPLFTTHVPPVSVPLERFVTAVSMENVPVLTVTVPVFVNVHPLLNVFPAPASTTRLPLLVNTAEPYWARVPPDNTVNVAPAALTNSELSLP